MGVYILSFLNKIAFAFLSKITFQNIAKGTIMSFIYFLFPLISLMLFYNPAISILGLLFSYISIIGVIVVMNVLMFVKDKLFIIADFVSNQTDKIKDEKMHKIVKNTIKAIALLLSVVILYISFHISTIFFSFISLISVLNPIMILALDIYYVIMALVFTGYNG